MMSNSSSGEPVTRLLLAVAEECRAIAADIAWLGGQITGGTADSAALQSFDFLAQHAQTQGQLIAHVAQLTDDTSIPANLARLVREIPLPKVRTRLLRALDGNADDESVAGADNSNTVFWLD
jgi:hypothetical protein